MTDYESDLTGKSKSPAMAQTETTLLNNLLDKISEITVVDARKVEDAEEKDSRTLRKENLEKVRILDRYKNFLKDFAEQQKGKVEEPENLTRI